MTQSALVGLALTIVAGMMSGNCMLPAKFVRSWKWGNVWLVFSVFSLVILPWSLAFLLVGHLGLTYSNLSMSQLAVPIAFGAGWGIAQVLFGISVTRLGLGVAYSIIVGLGAVLGTLVPLFVEQRHAVSNSTLCILMGGVLLMVLGIALTAWGGHLREKSGAETVASSAPRSGYLTSVAIAVLCGLMAPMLNFSFAFGQDIAHQAVALGNSPALAAYSVWPIALAGGFVPNFLYSVFLLARDRGVSAFRSPYPDFLWSTLMAVLWMGAFALYGMSATYLGTLGTSVGWGLFQIFMITTAILSGVLTGEWKGSSIRARAYLGTGLLFLILATVLFTAGNSR
jgi:L-rhamnose-H+ transport protein